MYHHAKIINIIEIFCENLRKEKEYWTWRVNIGSVQVRGSYQWLAYLNIWISCTLATEIKWERGCELNKGRGKKSKVK